MSAMLDGRPAAWGRRSPRSLRWRIFATAWIVFSLHFATDIVREHYPAIALGDDLTFRLDEFGGLHPDLFETPGRGWHIGNNPGISMFAAIPYAVARPLIDPIVERVQEGRAAAGLTEPPAYDTEWPNQREFFAEAWRRGLDVKLALAALVMQVLFMAPVCAGAVVLMFGVLRHVFGSDRSAGWMSLLFAFGTPLFYRAGFLNHNMVLGLIAFAAFALIWDPAGTRPLSVRAQMAVAGLAAGLTLLFDYSGVVFVALLFGYAILRNRDSLDARAFIERSFWFGVGGAGPVFLLWFYQWRAFGNPFLPGQHWMPPVEWIELGYQGYGPPQLELLGALAFDHRFGEPPDLRDVDVSRGVRRSLGLLRRQQLHAASVQHGNAVSRARCAVPFRAGGGGPGAAPPNAGFADRRILGRSHLGALHVS
jgi:hypothetical protein